MKSIYIFKNKFINLNSYDKIITRQITKLKMNN